MTYNFGLNPNYEPTGYTNLTRAYHITFIDLKGNELETAKDDVKEAVKFVDELRISEDGEPYYQGTWVPVVKNSKGKWVEKK